MSAVSGPMSVIAFVRNMLCLYCEDCHAASMCSCTCICMHKFGSQQTMNSIKLDLYELFRLYARVRPTRKLFDNLCCKTIRSVLQNTLILN